MEEYQMFSSSSAWSPPQQTFTNFHGGVLGFTEMKKENAINNNTSSSKSAAEELPRGGQAEDQASGSSGFVNDGSEDKKKRGNSNNTKRVRKPKYAFQTRSPVDILDDGYRWRKYGQKAVKNNRFPRSYYRCTHQGCSVKKQVQRLTRDESVVVTTYEGVHSHPIDKPSENFEQILSQMQIYTPF